jgi:hypothetical protein
VSLLARFLPHPPMPEPDPRCRTYDFAQTVELLRNHETQFRQSRELHALPRPAAAASPPSSGGSGGDSFSFPPTTDAEGREYARQEMLDGRESQLSFQEQG